MTRNLFRIPVDRRFHSCINGVFSSL